MHHTKVEEKIYYTLTRVDALMDMLDRQFQSLDINPNRNLSFLEILLNNTEKDVLKAIEEIRSNLPQVEKKEERKQEEGQKEETPLDVNKPIETPSLDSKPLQEEAVALAEKPIQTEQPQPIEKTQGKTRKEAITSDLLSLCLEKEGMNLYTKPDQPLQDLFYHVILNIDLDKITDKEIAEFKRTIHMFSFFNDEQKKQTAERFKQTVATDKRKTIHYSYKTFAIQKAKEKIASTEHKTGITLLMDFIFKNTNDESWSFDLFREFESMLDILAKSDFENDISVQERLEGFKSHFNEQQQQPKKRLHNEVYFYYSMISVTLPAPTVLPPSRIENLVPFSIAIG